MGGNQTESETSTKQGITDSPAKKWWQFWKNEDLTLPPFDSDKYGELIEYDIPEGYEEIEKYWVDEPYALVSIRDDKTMKSYHVVEPTLSEYEYELLNKIYADLQDVLTLEDTKSKEDRETILTKKTLALFKKYHASLDVPAMHKIIYYLMRDFINYGKISPLMKDKFIEDISCDGIDIPIFLYHSTYRNIITNISFEEEKLNSFVIGLCQKGGKQASIGEPIVDATLPDGSRLNATLGKEVTTRGSSYSIRKFRSDPITPVDLIGFNTCNTEMVAYFWLAIENGMSAIVAGGTASGKTSMLNSMSLFIPPLSKVVSIEDTRELVLHHNNWIAGLTRKSFTSGGAGEVSMFDLLKAALRQRPEYILVGEVRGEEALTMFQAMSTGHTTYSTIHASDVQTVVNRLESHPIKVPHVMLQALDILCIQKQTFVGQKRVRRTDNLVELTGFDPKTGNLRINELYRWDAVTDTFLCTGDSHVMKKVMDKRGWSKEELNKELKNRELIIEYLIKNKMRDYVTISHIMQACATDMKVVLSAIKKDKLKEILSNNRFDGDL